MTKSALILAAALALTAVQASAQATVEDADGNGAYSMEELNAAYPDVTAEAFAEMDTDGSGDLSDEELNAAMEAGSLGE